MDSDLGKLFIGGISWETTEERLKEYFSNYGEVTETVIMKDRATGRARGFGFVVFADPTVADRVLLEKHAIDGRTVEAKKAVPRDEQQNVPRSVSGGPVAADSIRTKKIFVGGLASTVKEEDFKKYFEQFGTITDVVVMYDQATQRPRGFGFITFDSEDAVDNVLQKSFHELNDKLVEVKRAIPKELQVPAWARSPGGPVGGRGSPFGSGYGQGYSVSAGGYGGRYGSSVGGRGEYPTYGGSVYGSSGYVSGGSYGPSMNGSFGGSSYGGAVGYGSGAGYGGSTYGSGSPPYGAGAAGYNSVGSSGSGNYGSGSGRNPWGSGGYGGLGSSAGYAGGGGGGYGSSSMWGSGSGGTGQAAGSTGAYGSAGYGYVGSQSSTGSYGGRGSGYGSGGRGFGAQSSTLGSGGYSTTSYGDGYGTSVYPDSTWRSTSTEPYGAASGAATGYGGAVSGADTSAARYGVAYGESGWHSQASDARFKSYSASDDHAGY